MKQALLHQEFRWLFAAQILSLLGIGIMSVALALAAYRLGGAAAAAKILGTVFALKMIAYVFLAPLAEALFARFHPKPVLIGLDLLRLSLLVPMAFVTQAWQMGMLLFLFYAASAAFTPLYQAIIPLVLSEEKAYTDALALSRLAYTLEAMLSPVLAGVALMFVLSQSLFPLAAFSFACSVWALWQANMPGRAKTSEPKNIWARLSKGLRIYTHTPRLRGLFVLNLGLSFGLAWVLVNSVVYVAQQFGNTDQYYTYLMSAYGVGAALAAVCVPALLQRITERNLMIIGGLSLGLLSAFILFNLPYSGALLLWCAFGAASSLALTPGGLVLKRSAAKSDLPAVFAAQFSMSHAGWLLAYPTAGWLGAELGPEKSLLVLGVLCILFTLLAFHLWPADDPVEREHSHPVLPGNHPHLVAVRANGSEHSHTHAYHIDDLHVKWDE